MRKHFIFLALSNFFFFAGISFFNLFPKYLGDLGASKTYIGIIMGIQTGVFVLLGWKFRNSIDILDKKKYLVFAAFLSLLNYLGYYFFSNLYTIPILRFIQGIVYAIGFPFGVSLAFQIIPESKRTGLIGLFGISGALTSAVSAYIGEKLIEKISFETIFLSAALASILWIFFLLLVKVPKTILQKKIQRASIKDYLNISFLAILFGAVFSSFFSFISHYCTNLKIFPIYIFFAGSTLLIILIRILFYKHLNRWKREKIILFSFIFSSLALINGFLLKLFPTVFMLGIAGASYGLAHGFLYPSLNVLFVEQTPKRSGKASIIFLLFFNLGITLSSSFYGILADFFGYPSMYLISAGITMTAIFLFYLVRIDILALYNRLKKNILTDKME